MSDSEDELFREFRAAAERDMPAPELTERILAHVAYRTRLEAQTLPLGARRGPFALGGLAIVVAAAAAIAFTLHSRHELQPITADPGAAPARDTRTLELPPADPCRDRGVALGGAPLIDDFEDGDDAIAPVEQRAGFWRWAREIDAPGTAPALLPVPRLPAAGGQRFALHVKGGELVDWGATVEVAFRPACYDATRHAGVAFEARGAGRIYFAPREVGTIPVAEGGSCLRDCYNPHVKKVDLGPEWRTYKVRWEEVRQRGAGKAPLDPSRLNSLAFLIRHEDTPYDVWLDDVRFIPR